MELAVLKSTGEPTGRTILLPASVFGIEPHEHAVYLDIKSILAARRQGTHKAKTRGEVSGSRRKIRRQKGSGGARFGDIKSPIFRGGGRIFGPVPRDYSFKVNQKVKELARRSILSAKAQEKAIVVLESLTLEAPSTKAYLSFLKGMSLANEKVLLITKDVERNLVLSARNLHHQSISFVGGLNSHLLISATKIVILEDAFASLVDKMVSSCPS